MERATGAEVYGCGLAHSTEITLDIQTITGGNFSISLNGKNTVEHLKELISKKLKVSKDRICLLHRERQLRDGTLEENGLLDGSRIILLPSVETGLLSQRPENSVMQALESLDDTLNDFLSGKSPLHLSMQLGDNTMLIQLQMSTLNSSSSGGSRIETLETSTPVKSSSVKTKCDSRDSSSSQTPHKSSQCDEPKQKNQSFLQKHDIDMIQNAFELYKRKAEEKFGKKASSSKDKEDTMNTSNCTLSDLADASIESEQAPIKSTENREAIANSVKSSLIDLVSCHKLSPEAIPSTSGMCDKVCPSTSHTPESSISDDSDNFTDQSSILAESIIDEYPIENLFNSAVDKGFFDDQDESMMDREISNLATTSHGTRESSATLPSFQSLTEQRELKNKRFQYLLDKSSKFTHPIGHNQSDNKHNKKTQATPTEIHPQPSTSRTEQYVSSKKPLEESVTPSTSKQSPKVPDAPKKPRRVSSIPPVVTKALKEASKNFTQKLNNLPNEVLTNKIDLRTAERSVHSEIGPEAVVESIKQQGKGIYSVTFSALQDRNGQPKRDISSMIHILNDLLCALIPILGQMETKHSSSTVLEEPTKCNGHSSKQTCEKNCSCRISPQVNECTKCDTANTLALDNSKTKCKLEQLKLVMQQKKETREASKVKKN